MLRRSILLVLLLSISSLALPGAASAAKHHPRAPMAGKYFWHNVIHPDYAWDNRGVYFVDGKWAYRGFAKGGLPRCHRKTAKGSGDGCVRYHYNRKSGRLIVGSWRGSYRDHRLTLGGDGWYSLTVPKRGARYAVALVHRSFRGFCGPFGGCTTSLDSLVLTKQGQFLLAHEFASSFGTGSFYSYAGSYPPSQRGTYQVLKGGRVKLAFADGTVAYRTIGIEQNASHHTDPAHEGLLLDEDNFYTEDD